MQKEKNQKDEILERFEELKLTLDADNLFSDKYKGKMLIGLKFKDTTMSDWYAIERGRIIDIAKEKGFELVFEN